MICKRSQLVRIFGKLIRMIGKEQLEELKKMKKVKEPLLTVEEKASKQNK
jgi:hypothetical protein